MTRARHDQQMSTSLIPLPWYSKTCSLQTVLHIDAFVKRAEQVLTVKVNGRPPERRDKSNQLGSRPVSCMLMRSEGKFGVYEWKKSSCRPNVVIMVASGSRGCRGPKGAIRFPVLVPESLPFNC